MAIYVARIDGPPRLLEKPRSFLEGTRVSHLLHQLAELGDVAITLAELTTPQCLYVFAPDINNRLTHFGVRTGPTLTAAQVFQDTASYPYWDPTDIPQQADGVAIYAPVPNTDRGQLLAIVTADRTLPSGQTEPVKAPTNQIPAIVNTTPGLLWHSSPSIIVPADPA